MLRSVVLGCGAYLPEKVLTNEDIAKIVDTSHDWVVERTGIHQRHIAADGELTSDLALAAAKNALERAGRDAQDIDLIVLATATPDNTFPATATAVQAQLGIHHGCAFDIQAVCSGFVYALSTADNFLKCGQHKRALVIGSETFSRILDWEDRTTCVLFGDGAGAVVLEAQEALEPWMTAAFCRHICAPTVRHYDKLYVDGGASRGQEVGHLRMSGPRCVQACG